MKNSILVVTLFVILGCKTQQPVLTNTEWKLVKMNDQDVSSLKTPVTIVFDAAQKKITGFGGCNRYFGAYQTENSLISFSGIGATKMFCQDTQQIEDTFFQSLSTVQSLKSEENRLYLLREGKVVLEFGK